MKHAATWLLAALFAACVQSCTRERATMPRDLRSIVEIELEEMGFRDQALATRHKAELQARYERTLRGCIGHAIAASAMACVATAKTTEELSHKCLH
jgi:hypothetical protein